MTTLPCFRTLATLAVMATATACGTTTPSGLAAARRLDPLNTAPTDIALAVGVPQALRLADGDAEFRFAFRRGSAGATINLEEVAPLTLSAATTDGPRPSAPDEAVYIARIASEDAARIAALQRQIRDLRAAGTDGDGSLTVRVVGGCFVGAPPRSIAVSTWLQTDPDDGFVQLTRRQDVTRAIGARDAAMLLSQLSPCAPKE